MADMKDVLLKEPEAKNLKPWQCVSKLGIACDVHTGYDEKKYLSIHDRQYCPSSEPYEKSDCHFVTVWQIKCRFCDWDSARQNSARRYRPECEKHKLVLTTEEVYCYIVTWWESFDFGYGCESDNLFVLSRHSGQILRFKVPSYKDNWLKKMLAYIKKEAQVANFWEKFKAI